VNKINHIGEKIGALTVIGDKGKDKHGKPLWICSCSCGSVKTYIWCNVKDQRSCGCIRPRSRKWLQVDLTGKRYSKLLVLREWGKTKTGAQKWLCQCDCGKQNIVDARSLKRGDSNSCGCVNQKDLTNKRFSNLLVIKEVGRSKNGCIVWLCKCDCGKTTEVSSNSLLRLNTRSCGCLACGEKHYNYNKQLTDKERKTRRNINGLAKWVLNVLGRDRYTCQVCGGKGVCLHAHHIDSWHWCKEKRLDVDNGATMCVKCHRRFHKEYGFKLNNKEQFSKFIKGV